MADMNPAEKYALGAKFKRAGILVAIIGALVSAAVGGGLWLHGEQLQVQAAADARAHGWGYLTVRDASGKVIEGLVLDGAGHPALDKHGDLVCRKAGVDAPCPPPPGSVSLGGGANGSGKAR